MDLNKDTVLVTGAQGMVGCALCSLMPDRSNIIRVSRISNAGYVPCDLRDPYKTNEMFNFFKPKYVFHLAARVGGIFANSSYLGDFYTDNIRINTNVLECALKCGTRKVLSLLSTCIYPDEVRHPLTEDQIHNGPPHSSNYAYAYAKRMLDIQSQAYRDQYGVNFITAVPNNLFGEYDNFDLENSHVMPAMIRKMYEANQKNESVVLWGDGSPLREFTYAKDLARIMMFLMTHYNCREPINVGNTGEISIKKLAQTIAEVLQFRQEIEWDTSKPNGQHRKPSDNSKLIKLGWKQEQYTDFKEAVSETCKWFVDNYFLYFKGE